MSQRCSQEIRNSVVWAFETEARDVSMQFQAKDENTLRRYLLGDVSPDERETIEVWFMSDDDAYDVLVAAEDDLIDESLNGKLKKTDLERFNRYFLAAPERQRKLAFDRSLRRYVNKHRPPHQPGHLWDFLASFFRSRAILGYGCAALILLTIVGGGWSAFTLVRVQREFRFASDQLANVSSERETYRLNRTIAELNSAPQALLTFNLIPGISRSSSRIPRMTIPAHTKLVRVSLTLLDDNYDSYRVLLFDDGGRQLWTAPQLRATTTGDGKAVVVSVPGEVLSNGDYNFNLSGISNGQPPENISSYYFDVSQ